MCGICGIFSYKSNNEIDQGLLSRMTRVMSHRGPDGEGVFFSEDKKLALGHRRLSIIDLAGGHQPMANEDGNVWIVFNGEIYNHEELRRKLQEGGHIYKTRSDTETIIHLYEEYGTTCINQLEGMFAFCIWDRLNNKIFLARDRIGKKPLYYTDVNGILIFASEIKSILLHPLVERDVDLNSLYHYFTFLISPAPFTLFKGIRKLCPGHYLICEKQKEPRLVQYWDAIFPERESFGKYDEDYFIENIRILLRNSIKARMMSDVPFGVFLSGGIDSSLNVALMAEICDQPVNTFTVAYEGEDVDEFNELQYARQIAKMFETNHHEVVVNDKKIIDYLPELIYHQDEPIADPVCIPLYYVSRLARDSGVIVVQIGEGSDELFAGYDLYFNIVRLQRRLGSYKHLPGFIQDIISRTVPLIYGTLRGGDRYEAYKDLFIRAAADKLFLGGAILFSDISKRNLFTNNFLTNISDQNSLSFVIPIYEKIESLKPHADYLEKMIYLELKQRLPELLLMRVDKITMAASVEGRAPFLDHKLVEFAMKIPMEIKIKNQPKYILKKAAEGIIPNNIIYRKKRGFPGPVDKWLKGKLGPYMKRTFDNDAGLKKRDWLNYDYINKMLHMQLRKECGFDRHLWAVLNFSLWYDYWIEGKEIGFEK